MANPSLPIDCPEGQYTKVATGVLSGQIWRIKGNAEYYYTYRVTEDPAPTEFSGAVRIFKDDDSSENFVNLEFKELVDIYFYCLGADGQVRVDV